MLAKRLYRYNLLANIIYYYKVNRKFEGRSVPQKWVDDVLQELRDFWSGEPLRLSSGIHR